MPEPEVNINEAMSRITGVLSRRRWWIALTATAVALATILVSLKLPNKYLSDATLMVVQQQISTRFVEPDSTRTAADVIQSMTRDILSRPRLAGIIDELGLYPDARKEYTTDQLAAQMQNNVAVEPLDQVGRSDYGAFKVSFTASNPRLAQAVTSRLASLFIAENLKNRGESASQTSSFLAEQLEMARRKMEQQEQRLQGFRMQNLSDLPEQQAASFARLTEMRINLQNATVELNRAQQQRVSLEAAIRGNLATLETEKTALLTRYTPRHAEVIRKEQETAQWQDLLDHWRSAAHVVTNTTSPAIVSLKSQIDSNSEDIEKLTRQQQSLNVQIEQFQSRVSVMPIREQQLGEIQRDYDVYKTDYANLQSKVAQSQMTTALEGRQQGQQFRITDPPTLPTVPVSPQRVKICLGGLAAGLFLGLALAFFIDAKDQCFHLEKDISRTFPVPLVIGVPLLLTPSEARRLTWQNGMAWLAVSAMAVVVMAAELYIYRRF